METLELGPFSGVEKLLGKEKCASLLRAHVAVVGIGGVGSWAAESLARSGVGNITLIDLDDICVSNINRQLHASSLTLGQNKTQVMRRRLLEINPHLKVHAISEFLTEKTKDLILPSFNYVIDAIDGLSAKATLLNTCLDLGVPVVTVGAAGGRRDPTQIRVADLAHSERDQLLKRLRKKLRRNFGYQGEKNLFGVLSVFSMEIIPQEKSVTCDNFSIGRRDCNSHLGTASYITGVFGLVAASVAINNLKSF